MDLIEWSDFPFKDKPLKGTLSLIFIIFISMVVFFFWSKFLGIVSFLVLFLSVIPFYTVTHYRIDRDGIAVKNMGMVRKKKWEEIKRVYVVKNGLFFSPFEYETRLEHYRGILMRVYGDKKKQAIDFIKSLGLKLEIVDSSQTSWFKNSPD